MSFLQLLAPRKENGRKKTQECTGDKMKFRAFDKTKQRHTENHDNLAITFNGDIIFIDKIEKLKQMQLITNRNDLEIEVVEK